MTEQIECRWNDGPYRVLGDGFTFTAHFSPWRRRWVGRCTCGSTLKPIFRDRAVALPLSFMRLHGEVSHA